MKIAENLKKFRKQQGLSQKELAQVVGVNQTMIAHIENGVKSPRLRLVLN